MRSEGIRKHREFVLGSGKDEEAPGAMGSGPPDMTDADSESESYTPLTEVDMVTKVTAEQRALQVRNAVDDACQKRELSRQEQLDLLLARGATDVETLLTLNARGVHTKCRDVKYHRNPPPDYSRVSKPPMTDEKAQQLYLTKVDGPAPTLPEGWRPCDPMTPPARTLMRKHGISLADLQGRGTGSGGRITRSDVEALVTGRNSSA